MDHTFSNHVYKYLAESHPSFLSNIEYKPDQSFDCSLLSPTKKFSVWIATFDAEITIGLDDPEFTSGAHTHMSFYGNEPEEQIKALEEFLEDIFSNKLIFMHSNLAGYTWTRDLVTTLMEKEDNEAIEFFTWTGDV